MSGIEIAGLVLGAVPIIIWGLGQYKTTRDIWYRSRSKALLIDRLIDALEEQRFLVEMDLKLLLRAAGFEDEEFDALDPLNCCEFFQKSEVVIAITQYLGQIYYKPYQKALKRCESNLADLARSIGGLMSGVQIQVSKLILSTRPAVSLPGNISHSANCTPVLR